MEGMTSGFIFFVIKNSIAAVITYMVFVRYQPQKAYMLSLLITPIIIHLIAILEYGGVDVGFAARILLSFLLAWPVIAIVERLFKHYQQDRIK